MAGKTLSQWMTLCTRLNLSVKEYKYLIPYRVDVTIKSTLKLKLIGTLTLFRTKQYTYKIQEPIHKNIISYCNVVFEL